MVYSCSAPEQEYTMAWPGILLHLLISSLKIRFCEQSVFAKSPLPNKSTAELLQSNISSEKRHICWPKKSLYSQIDTYEIIPQALLTGVDL